MKTKNEKLTELTNRLSELMGIKMSWYGSNGEYAISNAPFHYLNSYHTKKDMILYMEGIIAGFKAGQAKLVLKM